MSPANEPNAPDSSSEKLANGVRCALALGGVFVLGVAVALLVGADTPGASTTSTAPVPVTVVTKTEPTLVTATTSTTPTSTTVTTLTRPGATQVVSTPGATVVKAVPGHAAAASDSLIVLLVGLGGGLLLSGISGRTVKLGFGGSNIEFTAPVERKVAAVVGATVADPLQREMVFHGAVANLQRSYWGSPARPPDTAIARAVHDAAAELADDEAAGTPTAADADADIEEPERPHDG